MSFLDKVKPVTSTTTEPSFLSKATPIKQSGIKETISDVADIALPIVGGVAGGFGGTFMGAGVGAVPGAAIGTGAGASAAQALRSSLGTQEKTIPQQLKTIGIETAATYVGGKVLTKAFQGASKLAGKIKLKAQQTIVSDAQKEVNSFIKSKKSIESKVLDLENRGTPVREMLSDESIFRGLKVEKQSLNPDQAIAVVQERIDKGLKVAQQLLPEIDKYAPTISREAYRSRAYGELAKKNLLPADAKNVMRAIDEQIDALPDEILPSQLDKIRAQARVSSRSAKGIQKRDSEYTALENAARDMVFESADKLPVAQGGEFAGLRGFIKQNIDLETFLDTTMRGQKVSGGKLGVYGGRILGGLAGAQSGVLTSIVGAEAGARIANIITNNALGSSVKLRMIKEMVDDPKALQKIGELFDLQQKYVPPELTAPLKGAFRSQVSSGKTITPSVTTYESASQKIKTEAIKLKERLQLNAGGKNPIQLPEKPTIRMKEDPLKWRK